MVAGEGGACLHGKLQFGAPREGAVVDVGVVGGEERSSVQQVGMVANLAQHGDALHGRPPPRQDVLHLPAVHVRLVQLPLLR